MDLFTENCLEFIIFHESFFFKQKTAYEMLRSLVGSEMCIRDRITGRLKKNISNNIFNAGSFI